MQQRIENGFLDPRSPYYMMKKEAQVLAIRADILGRSLPAMQQLCARPRFSDDRFADNLISLLDSCGGRSRLCSETTLMHGTMQCQQMAVS
jgi:hypothetical protein